MDSKYNSEPKDGPVTTVGSRRAVGDKDRNDYLIKRLEEMFAKLEKRSKNTDAWEGEDEEGEEERGEEKRRRKPQRQAKEKFSPNVSETAKAGGLGDAGKNVEMIQQKERNRFSFRN
uniref:Uncharacterized protein n=1 Tax=Magallana gigas TaxID=29159 RepID=A0A8W8K3H6_MAGGI|nr:uncharacterized protein LOC117692641 [Crassostrea gigas]